MDHPFKLPSVLSIGPGFLGLERGLQRAIGKMQVRAYVEVESFIVANLIAGMQTGVLDEVPMWVDIKTFHQVAKHFRKKIHGIIAGYPCQPFSLAGKRKGHQDPGHIYPYISDTIRTTGPVWCFFENVSGHLSMGFDVVYKDLRSMGYAVEAGIYTAEEAGAPHQRERLFILAISERFLSYTRRKRIRWETGADISGGSQESELGNTESNNQCNDWNQSRQSEFKIRRYGDSESKTMGNSQSSIGRLSICQQRQTREPESNSVYTSGSSETELEYTNNTRCREQCIKVTVPTKFTPVECTSAFNGNSKDKWPAGPGSQQYEWEQPRTVISQQTATLLGAYSKKYPQSFQTQQVDQVAFNGFTSNVKSWMGSTVNGYNFREDLLRAYGNSVVEQTAEIAFIDLLQKHWKNINM